MARRTIIDYLIEGKKRGFSDEVLKDDLLDNGFDEKVIDDAFYQLKYQMKLQRQSGKSSSGASPSGWGEEFGSGSGKMPRQPNEKEKSSSQGSQSSYAKNKGAIEGIKHRGWGLVLILSMITFGIYGIYWLVSTTKELRKNTDSAPSPHWLWFVLAVPVGGILASGGAFLGLSGIGGGTLSIAGSALLVIYAIVMLYYEIFYSVALSELSGFSKFGLIALWILLPIVAMPLSQYQLNKFADK